MHKLTTRRAWFFCLVTLITIITACGPAAQTETAESETEARGSSSVESTRPVLVEDPEPERGTDEPEQSPNASIPAAVDETSSDYDANGIQVGFTADGHPYRGDPDAAVVIEEFSDFQCPYCVRFFEQTLPSIDENQIANGEVLLIFYDFPLTTIHPQAMAAANAARCAAEQGAVAFWQMHDLIFTSMESWANRNANSGFSTLARQIGIDLERFEECQENERYLESIQADLDLGRGRGVGSTPSFFINDQPLIGAQPLPIFDQAIALAQDGELVAEAVPTTTQTQPAEPAAKPTPATIRDSDYAGSLGEPDAPVTIVEYTDFQCPFCQRHVQQTLPLMMEAMITTGRVRYVLKDFPLDSIHPEARQAALAARCAGEQQAYWEMHDALFAEQSEWAGQGSNTAVILSGIAADLSLDTSAFQSCMASRRFDEVVQSNQDEGISLGVRGTPFFFVNGFPINGAQPYELFEYAIGLAEEGTLADAYSLPPQAEPTAVPQPTGPVDVPIEGSFSIGDPEAPIIMVEYTDYQCPFCSRHFQQTMPQIRSNFIDQGLVYYVFKDFPLTNIHPQAMVAAEAARCAGEQEAYPQMHDALFDQQQEWSNRSDADQLFVQYADELDLDTTQFRDCLSSRKYQDAVMADLDKGIGFGVRGTPAFFINGNFLSGAQPYSVFEQAINSLLSESE
jgi:protein-disulfide isomerase